LAEPAAGGPPVSELAPGDPAPGGRAWPRQVAETVRNGRRLYRADSPVRVQLTTAAPRAVLQGIFLVLAGRVIGGRAGEPYALAGAAAFLATSRTIVYVGDIVLTDRLSETYYRLQGGVLPPWLVCLLRLPPYIASGFISSLLALAVCGPLLGLSAQSARLLPLLPLYLLTACTTAAFGLAVSALAVGRQTADILLGNLASFLILACSRVVAPDAGAARWLADAGTVLPVTHGLQAVRAQLAGQAWAGQAGLEAAVGAAWVVLAIVLLAVQDRRARGGPALPRPRRRAA
jgi:ABC-2 type transport system permease protein